MRLIAALLAATLPLTGAAGQAQLLPAGEFAARDGRPGPGQNWRLSDEQGARLAADVNALAARTPIVIDYEHQTLHAEANGQAAPAAGWIRSVEWRTGAGLFASVEWTARAKAHIEQGEYRYISPVITFGEDGQVTGLMLAALVNHPALTGMEPVIAQLRGLGGATNPRTQQEPHMDLAALLATILPLLGLQPGVNQAQIAEAITALKARPLVPAALGTALGLQAGADEAAALSAVQALKSTDATTLQTIQALQAQVAALSTQNAERQVTEMVDAALAAKKLLPAQRDWALGLGRKDVAQLKSFIDSAPVIPGLGGQSDGKDPGDGGSAALSGATAGVLEKMGLTAEQFAKGKV